MTMSHHYDAAVTQANEILAWIKQSIACWQRKACADEYNEQFWSLIFREDAFSVEQMQRRATRLISKEQNKRRIKKCNLSA